MQRHRPALVGRDLVLPAHQPSQEEDRRERLDEQEQQQTYLEPQTSHDRRQQPDSQVRQCEGPKRQAGERVQPTARGAEAHQA
jgi:hypothetical protein